MTEAKPCLRECVARWVGHYVTYHHAKGCRNTGPLVWPKRPGPRASEAPDDLQAAISRVVERDGTASSAFALESPAPAHKVHGDDCVDDCNGCSCWCHPKPAPAPEPKQGSEEPIDWEAAGKSVAGVTRDAPSYEFTFSECRNLARAYLALRAEVETWKEQYEAETRSFRNLVAFAREPITPNYEKPMQGEHNVVRDTLARLFGFEITATQKIDALRAELSAADQNLKTMLQAAGEEAERQLAAAREEIAKLRKFVSEAMHEADAEKARADRAEERVVELLILHRRDHRDEPGCALCEEAWKHILSERARKDGGSR